MGPLRCTEEAGAKGWLCHHGHACIEAREGGEAGETRQVGGPGHPPKGPHSCQGKEAGALGPGLPG
jgi:hypothetical protein